MTTLIKTHSVKEIAVNKMLELENNLKQYSINKAINESGLIQINKGSSRYCYTDLENKIVIKRTFNDKGIAQSELEISLSNDYYTKDLECLNAVLDHFTHNNIIYTAYEYCNKVDTKEFKKKYNNLFTFKDFLKTIEFHQDYLINIQRYKMFGNNYYNNIFKKLYDNYQAGNFDNDNNILNELFEYFYNLADLIGNYYLLDLHQKCNFGVNSKGELKIIDYGCSENKIKNIF